MTVKLNALVGSNGCVPVGYMPLKIGRSSWAATSMKKFGQKVAAAGDAQGGFAVEDDIGVVAVGVLQINIFKSGPASAAVQA